MKRPYCCDESRDLFERYYDRQQKGKGDFPVYVGRYMQKGHGIGSVISSLFRRILPALKMVVPHVLRTGASVLEDVSSGKRLKDSAIKRIPEAMRRVRIADKSTATAALSTAANFLENSLSRYLSKEEEEQEQTGSGKRKRRKKIVSRKRHKKDIFD